VTIKAAAATKIKANFDLAFISARPR